VTFKEKQDRWLKGKKIIKKIIKKFVKKFVFHRYAITIETKRKSLDAEEW
jgi:hypothetical protein